MNQAYPINTPKNTSSDTEASSSSDNKNRLTFPFTGPFSHKNILLDEKLNMTKRPKSPKKEAIRTFCRIRPFKGENELFSISENDDRILNIIPQNVEKLQVGNNLKLINSYTFSKVFSETSTQDEVFNFTCKPLIDDLILNHKSGLIFAYGMTNAGKTYTMVGTPEQPGILPIALQNLLEYDIKDNNFAFYCNFIEIYQEEVLDLLADDPNKKNKYYKKKLNMKENLNSVFFLQDVTYAKLDTLSDFNSILNKGIAKKVHSSTALNQNSSRSHTIFKIILLNKSKDITKIDFSTEELISISVVDLAGSERQKRTDAKGKNLQEACKINQSLSTLGKCLEAMKYNSTSNNKRIVPIRESKLTKLFSEYFQGDQNIIMITNINPRPEDFEETIRALNYSCLAKDIKPIKSIIPRAMTTNELKNQLKREKKLIDILNNSEMEKDNKANEEKMNPLFMDKNDKLDDTITFNVNDFFNNSRLGENDKDDFLNDPNINTSSKEEEINKLVEEIKKLREEVQEFKKVNNEEKKRNIFQSQSFFDKNKLNNNNNPYMNPYSCFSQSDQNTNDFLKSLDKGDDSPNDPQEKKNTEASDKIHSFNHMNNNEVLVPYNNGIFGYPYNNPFIPYPYTSLTLPDQNNCIITDKNGKMNNKNKRINDMLNNSLKNFPGFQRGFNLILYKPRISNLFPSSIREESSESSDDEDEPKKRKVRHKNNKNKKKKTVKYLGKEKHKKSFIYPKINKKSKDNSESSDESDS